MFCRPLPYYNGGILWFAIDIQRFCAMAFEEKNNAPCLMSFSRTIELHQKKGGELNPHPLQANCRAVEKCSVAYMRSDCAILDFRCLAI